MENHFDKPFTFDRVARIVFSIIIIAVVLLFINSIKSVLLPFLVAWLIAYIINPVVEWNQRILRLQKRTPAIFITFGEIAVALTLIGLIVIPMIIHETRHLYELVSLYVQSSNTIPLIPASVQDFLRQYITSERIGALLSPQEWIKLGQDLLTQIGKIVSTSVHGLATFISWAIVLLYIFFILQDYEAVINLFSRLIPHRYRPIANKIGRDVKESMNRYFRGQALIAALNGLLHCIGFLIIGLPMAIPLGILVGVLNLIPYMQILSYIPALFLCIIGAADGGSSFWVLGGLTIAVFVIAQIIQEAFLTPRIMGNATGLNPAIILLSLSIWGSLLGFAGLIIALPLTSLLLAYYQRYIIGEKSEQNNQNTNTSITTN